MTTTPRPPARSRKARSGRTGRDFRWIYLWHWPIRAMHWIAAVSIVTLIATGFYIGQPYFMTGGEASEHFLMGRVRLAHFIAAGLLVATGIVRVYWLFAGDRYETWRALFPFSAKSRRGLIGMAKYYLMLPRSKHLHYLGHNPMQQITYTGVYALVVVEVLTGFALFGLANPGGFFATVSAWTAWFPGGIRGVRFVHHCVTWLLLTFIPIHVYLGMRADVIDREGTMSSIVSGGRWVPVDENFEDG